MAFWNDYGISDWVVVFISLFGLLYLYINGKFRYWKSRGVKSLSLWDVVRKMRDMRAKSIHDSVLINYRKFGRIHGSYIGLTPQMVVGDPVLLKQILVKDFNAFHNRVYLKSGNPLHDNMLSIMTDDDWKRVRCLMIPTFTGSRMRKMTNLIKECAEKFSKFCEKIAERSEEVDCKRYYAGFMIDLIALTAFGSKINALDDPNHPFVQRARKLSTQDSLSSFLIMALLPKLVGISHHGSSAGGVFRYFRDFAQHVIEEREKKNIRMNDFLQLMVDAQRGQLEESEEDLKEKDKEQQIKILPEHKSMSVDEMYAQCVLFLIAGSETTSSTLAFISYYLALNPDCQERLIEEIDEACGNHGEINYDVANKMTYLDAVICEVLRLKPIATTLMRTACEDYQLGDTGIVIEKGKAVIVPVYGMHLDPEFFPEPEKFVPERFMPHNRQSIPHFVYLPFGDGPRNCIGMRFANLVLKLCIIYLLRTVRFEATENTKKPLQYYKGEGIMRPKAVMIKIRKRDVVTKT